MTKIKMTDKQFYNWRVIYPNGEIYYNKGIKLKDLKAPFRFELLPLMSHLQKYFIDIKREEKLIYFRRVKGHFTIGFGDQIDWIRYCIGKKVGDYTAVLWIDAGTGTLKMQNGENIKL